MVLPGLMFLEIEISHVGPPQREAKEGNTSHGAFQHLQNYSDPHFTDSKVGVYKGIHTRWPSKLEADS